MRSAYCLGSVADSFCPRSLLIHWSLLCVTLTTKQRHGAGHSRPPRRHPRLTNRVSTLLWTDFPPVETGSCLSFKFQQPTRDCQHVLHSCCSAWFMNKSAYNCADFFFLVNFFPLNKMARSRLHKAPILKPYNFMDEGLGEEDGEFFCMAPELIKILNSIILHYHVPQLNSLIAYRLYENHKWGSKCRQQVRRPHWRLGPSPVKRWWPD